MTTDELVKAAVRMSGHAMDRASGELGDAILALSTKEEAATARAEAAEAKLAEAQKAWRESRGPLTAALDRLKELEAKLRDVVDAWDAPAAERTHPTLKRLHDPICRARAALKEQP